MRLRICLLYPLPLQHWPEPGQARASGCAGNPAVPVCIQPRARPCKGAGGCSSNRAATCHSCARPGRFLHHTAAPDGTYDAAGHTKGVRARGGVGGTQGGQARPNLRLDGGRVYTQGLKGQAGGTHGLGVSQQGERRSGLHPSPEIQPQDKWNIDVWPLTFGRLGM